MCYYYVLKIGDVRVRCLRYCDFNRIYEKAERGFYVPLFMLHFIRSLLFCKARCEVRERQAQPLRLTRTAQLFCPLCRNLEIFLYFFKRHFSSLSFISLYKDAVRQAAYLNLRIDGGMLRKPFSALSVLSS